ncbi:DUF4245 domain-containing protein [Nocardia sp. CDC159]|uniref:DUF4245 domain-containing protein n=1 Tax=Nocardia pulmonis TaxID=2951408 RepID=A0A9X2IZF1_9NOCA|nr:MULTISPECIES: DUF4245 domain-containing protein [Nocardia]MCM6775960.1 DUF4245 domain-containing protein [Nocardia pulmonis]MCM6788064.1 DUF4245 domain-containing protein [Nocardia sp. CDC159]
MSSKPRILNDYKDLFWSLIPLVLICVVFAAVAQQCSVSTNGPTPGKVPDFDLHDALRDDARTLPFPIREPSLPADWRPNSGSRDTVTGTGGGAVSTVGFLTPQGTYMQLTQSNATVEALANHIEKTRTPSGTQKVADQVWTVYHVQGSEPAWITDLGPVRLLVKGAGNQAAYTTLAAAATAAQPIRP